jgi:hypothetical protein
MGINCGVLSYDGRLNFGLAADAQAAPDVDRLRDFLDLSYVELRAAAGIDKSEPSESAAAVPAEMSRRPPAEAAARKRETKP